MDTSTMLRDRVTVSDLDTALEHCDRMGWTDGLPIVAPTVERVMSALEAVGWEADRRLAYEPVRNREVSALLVAANAIMAGCRPEHLPVIAAVLESMTAPQYVCHGTITSTGGAAPYVVVNGPIRRHIDLNAEGNLFGPGARANATIGRAVRLIIRNVFEARPGVLDRSTQGNFGKYSGCFAENEEASPWAPFHTTRGFDADDSTVTVFAGESGHNILLHGMRTAEQLLDVIADGMRGLGSFSDGESLLVVSPEHATFLADRGFGREDVQSYLFERSTRTLAELKRAGKLEGSEAEPADGDESIVRHRGLSPDDVLVVVGGGEAGGHSAFFPSWSRIRGSLATTTAIRPGIDAEGVAS